MASPIPENHAKFTLSEIVDATNGVLVQVGSGRPSQSVQTDSRRVGQSAQGEDSVGFLFVALEGERFDGHRFVKAAAAAGASVVLVHRDVAVIPSVAVVRVPDTLIALGQLARFHRRRWSRVPHALGDRKVVAIGGSAGKTTTRKTTGALLSALWPGAIHQTDANLNNAIGVPMTLFGLTDNHYAAVVEVGTNVRGEVRTLTRIAEPDIGLLTLIAPEHTEGIGTLSDVAEEEGDLFAEIGQNGVVIGNHDDEQVRRQMARSPARKFTYGFSSEANLQIRKRLVTDLSSIAVEVERADDTVIGFEAQLLGDAGALATTAALAVAEAGFGVLVGASAANRAFGQLGEDKDGRLTVLRGPNDIIVIDDSYNANPASMRSSLQIAMELGAREGRRVVAVLGEMRELGLLAREEHENLGQFVGKLHPTLVLGVAGDAAHVVEHACSLGVCARFVGTSEEASVVMASWVRPNDLILVKGSRGVATEHVVKSLLEVAGVHVPPSVDPQNA